MQIANSTENNSVKALFNDTKAAQNQTLPAQRAVFFRIMAMSLCLFSCLVCQQSLAQTCPSGSPTAATGFGITASGGASGANNATGTILAASTTLNAGNSATLNNATPLDIDFQKWVAQGSTVTVAWARSAGTPTANVFYSNDSITFTSLGTLSGSASTASVYANFTVPAGGLRYIRITRTAGTLFIDGIRRTHTCYFPMDAVNDTRVFINPGTARGFVGSNDLNYDRDNRKFFPGYIGVSNGTLTFDTFGRYTYIPNSGFDGVDFFSYRVCDAGPDGNINTSNDNTCDTAVVLLRSLFNCDSTQFFIPLPENEAMDFLEDIRAANADPVQFYAGLSVSSDAVVIYDHWEDGFEADIKSPTQASTRIWGDGDLTNGVAPGFPSDILDAGKAIILSNLIKTGHTGATNFDPNAAGKDDTLRNYVDYDGGDKIFIGGIGALAKFSWGTAGTLSMSGTSVPPVSKWDTLYTFPIGITTNGGGISTEITSLSVMARANNTIIRIDRDANGTVDIRDTLAQGETRYVDSRFNGTTVNVLQGGTVRSDKPVMVTLMTGDFQTPSPGYEGRTYSLLPNSQLSTCYYMPGVPLLNMRVFLYNPTSSAITVTRTTAGGASKTIPMAANSSRMDTVNMSGLGYRYCAASGFAMITSVDHNSYNSDWGFMPVPTANLTPKVLVSIGAGVDPTNAAYGTLNYEQALVTVDDSTYLYVDTNGDGIADKVSFNSDVDVTDNAVTIGGRVYNETTSQNGIRIRKFQTVSIGSSSGNLNGATFWTKTAANNGGVDGANIALVWGQNDNTTAGAPNIDAGYTVPNVKPFIGNSVVIRSSDSICLGSNLDSITVRFNGVSPYRFFWFNENTNTFSTQNTSADSFVIKNLEPGSYLIKVKDANCNSFTQRVNIYQRTSGCFFNVSGTLFNDSNGLSNSAIDGRAFGNPSGAPMYVYLVDNLGIVVDSSVVNPSNGTYTLTGVRLSSYTLRLSTTAVGIGAMAPAASLPSGWVNTGEQYGTGNTGGSGVESGTANGNINVVITTSNVTNVNLGIERPPVNANLSYNITSPSMNMNDTMRLNRGGLMPGMPAASDPEDGSMGSGGNVKLYAPSSNELFYDANNDGVLDNSERITDSLVVTAYDPSRLIARYSTQYSTSLTFQYSFQDRAGRRGPRGTYAINWLVPLPVEIGSFKTECVANGRRLSWFIQTGQDAQLVLERSQSGLAWEPIAAFRYRQGNQTAESMQFTDVQPAEAVLFYRLSMKSDAGHSTYSGILRSDCSGNETAAVLVFPNPGNALVYVQGLASGASQVNIFNATGQEVNPPLVYAGNGLSGYNFESLPPGVYTFVISEADAIVEVVKVVIVRD